MERIPSKLPVVTAFITTSSLYPPLPAARALGMYIFWLVINCSVGVQVQALVGFATEIVHVDGHKVSLANPGVTIPGQVITIPKEGMPIYEEVSPQFMLLERPNCSWIHLSESVLVNRL